MHPQPPPSPLYAILKHISHPRPSTPHRFAHTTTNTYNQPIIKPETLPFSPLYAEHETGNTG